MRSAAFLRRPGLEDWNLANYGDGNANGDGGDGAGTPPFWHSCMFIEL